MKLARYFLVGGTAAIVDFSLFAVLFTLSNAWFESAAVSFIVATFVNYCLSVRYVFQSGVRFTTGHEIVLVFLVSGIGLILNQFMLWFLYREAGLNIWLSKIVATGAVFTWNFTGRNFFIFRPTK